MAEKTITVKPNYFYIFFVPDKTDLLAFFLCFPLVNFFQISIFGQNFGDYLTSIQDFSFFAFMGIIYLSYWAWRYGYSSLSQAVAAGEKSRENLVEKE